MFSTEHDICPFAIFDFASNKQQFLCLLFFAFRSSAKCTELYTKQWTDVNCWLLFVRICSIVPIGTKWCANFGFTVKCDTNQPVPMNCQCSMSSIKAHSIHTIHQMPMTHGVTQGTMLLGSCCVTCNTVHCQAQHIKHSALMQWSGNNLGSQST